MEILRNEEGEIFVMYSGKLGFCLSKIACFQPVILKVVHFTTSDIHKNSSEVIKEMDAFAKEKLREMNVFQ